MNVKSISAGAIVVLVALLIFWKLFAKPELKASPESLKTMDAMFTALTSKDSQRLEFSLVRLRNFQEQGQIDAQSMKTIEHCRVLAIEQGQWQTAAETLYELVN